MAEKKKILFVITKSNWGGAQKYVYDLATNLPNDRYDVAVVCGGNGILARRLKQADVRVLNILSLKRDVNFFREFEAARELLDIFKKEQPDIVHLNSTKAGGLGALVARIAKIKKIIFTAHGWVFNEDRNSLWKILLYLVSLVTALLSHMVITISHREKTQATMFPFIPDKKVYMIHIASKAPSFKEKEEARSYIMEQFAGNPVKNALWLGSIGELHANKGYIYALDACVKLKKEGINLFYTIIGVGEKRNEIQDYIRANNLEKNVFLAGNIPSPTEGATLLHAFDIFLLPSIKEGLPYVLVEAGHAELPVIASSVGGVPEIVYDQNSGILVPPKDSEALSVAIKIVARDYNLRAKLGGNLNEKVTEEFSFKDMVEKTIKVYEV